jgi:hypothetical protein
MDAVELRRAMERQAAAVNLRYEAGLANALLDDVAGEPAAMPLLQHALLELWRRRRGRWLKGNDYEAIGRVRGAIARTADVLYAELSEPEQRRVREIFVRLTRLGDNAPGGGLGRRDTRQRVPMADLVPHGGDPAATRALVARLADRRLVVVDEEDRVEVGHEALIRHWPLLTGWLDEDRAALRLRQSVGQAALEWDRGKNRESDLIHGGERLQSALTLLRAPRFAMNDRETAYLRACEALQQREDQIRFEQRWTNLDEVGWGVIFPDPSNFDEEAKRKQEEIREALGPLLEHRKAQATSKDARRYREFVGGHGVRPGESKRAFFARHGVGTGPADPDRMPYYLLIVGDPEVISFPFQCELDVQYAVGRLHFDTVEEYGRYARSVVAAETGKVALPCRAAFFGTSNPDDIATKLSAERLVRPLAAEMTADKPDWAVDSIVGPDATKVRLGRLLGGVETPAFLFTACHGLGFSKDDPRQLPYQGALLCQDWPGPQHWWKKGPIPTDHYFSADDVSADARVHGLIAFLVSSFSAAVPRWDEYPYRPEDRTPIAPHAFVSRLPQRLLERFPVDCIG